MDSDSRAEVDNNVVLPPSIFHQFQAALPFLIVLDNTLQGDIANHEIAAPRDREGLE